MLRRVVRAIGGGVLVYFAASFIFLVFRSFSADRSPRAVLYNIFTVVLVVAVCLVMLSDFLPRKKGSDNVAS